MRLISLIILINLSVRGLAQYESPSVSKLLSQTEFLGEKSNQFIDGYMTPLGKSIGNGMSTGWFNTGRPHKLPGFDITIPITAIVVPSEERSFSFDEMNEPTPTVMGEVNSSGIQYEMDSANFASLPSGTGIGFFVLPSLQVGIGLPFHTDFTIRYMDIENVKLNLNVNMIGFSIRSSLMQFFGPLDEAPIDISLQFAHSLMNVSSNFNTDFYDLSGAYTMNVKATTTNVILSKKLALITPYIAAGLNIHQFDQNMDWTSNGSSQEIRSLINNINSPNLATPEELYRNANIQITYGLRLTLLKVITFHGQYTDGQYNAFTMGFGISVR